MCQEARRRTARGEQPELVGRRVDQGLLLERDRGGAGVYHVADERPPQSALYDDLGPEERDNRHPRLRGAVHVEDLVLERGQRNTSLVLAPKVEHKPESPGVVAGEARFSEALHRAREACERRVRRTLGLELSSLARGRQP